MYQLHTEKQQKYFKEVIRLHYEEGYGENRIARIIPIGHTTAARWIAIFAREKGKIKGMANMAKSQETASVQTDSKDVKELQKKIKELEAQLLPADAGIGLPCLPDVLQGELLPGGLGQCRVSIILVIGLLAHAKQSAE